MRFSVRRVVLALAIVAVIAGAVKYFRDRRPPYSWERGLSSANASVRKKAAAELGRMGVKASRAVPALLGALRTDRGPAVRKEAAIALYLILTKSADAEANRSAIAALKAAQQDRDPAVRAAAAVGLCILHADPAFTSQALVRAAKEGDAWGRAQSVSTLAEKLPQPWARQDDVHHAIIAALVDPDAHVKETAVNGLLTVADRDPWILDTALESDDPSLRLGALHALQRNSQSAAAAYSVLLKALRDPDKAVRGAAARALSKASPAPDARIPEALVAALTDRNADVRRAAVISLGKFGARAEVTLPDLERLCADDDEGVRRAADQVVRSIESKLGKPDARIQLLTEMLAAPKPASRARAVAALGRLGPAARKALPALEKLAADDPDEEIRKAAARAKGAISGTD